MSKHHELKIWPEYFKAVREGRKTFEVRVNDRDFKEGDTVELMEWVPDTIIGEKPYPGMFTGARLKFGIGYVYTVDYLRCVFSLVQFPLEIIP